jgi:hypothetical protein
MHVMSFDCYQFPVALQRCFHGDLLKIKQILILCQMQRFFQIRKTLVTDTGFPIRRHEPDRTVTQLLLRQGLSAEMAVLQMGEMLQHFICCHCGKGLIPQKFCVIQ